MTETSRPQITKIVITGGPCAGKSTAMSWIQNAFTQLGYRVLFVPETATELISGGVAPWTCGTNEEYQKCQVRLQAVKEELFEQAARTMDADRILIVCDRGMMDNKVYMTEEEFARVLESIDLNEVQARDSYDAIFHLVTAAKGAVEFYTTANNVARYETVEEAVVVDDHLIDAWTGHPHLRIIDNSTGFDLEMRRLISEISSFLGEPESYEIERKFLINRPDLQWLENHPSCRKAEILQTYLKTDDEEEVRVRRRGIDGHYIYYRTAKETVSPMKRIEVERRLTLDEYTALLKKADPERKPVKKDRYCLNYDGQYFEIDVYPFWDDQAIMEIELSSEEEEIRIPEGIEVIREVTDDPEYRNEAIAARI